MKGKAAMFKRKQIGDEYMTRYFIIPRNRFFNIYIHRFIGDDKRIDLHDHPWHFASVLLSGGLMETYLTDTGWYATRKLRRFRPRLYRATYKHRFSLPVDQHSATTIVITGPRFRDWGFYRDKILTRIMRTDNVE